MQLVKGGMYIFMRRFIEICKILYRIVENKDIRKYNMIETKVRARVTSDCLLAAVNQNYEYLSDNELKKEISLSSINSLREVEYVLYYVVLCVEQYIYFNENYNYFYGKLVYLIFTHNYRIYILI